VAVTVGGCGADHAATAALTAPANTAKVERGELAAMVSQGGTLTYRAESDGSPYTAINWARGVYTKLPVRGHKVDCGDVLYRVDERPVVLLCGTVPAYRALHRSKRGRDVRELGRNLRALGYDTIKAFQHAKGLAATGTLALGDVVFLPKPVRISKVIGKLGAPARAGAPVVEATSDTLEVQVALDPSQQGAVKKGDSAAITLPGNTPASGKVEGFGRVAQAPGQDSKAADATIPTYISLDDPRKARGLDLAPVQVDITTEGVENALSVPVVALVGKSGGGFAVEVVRDDGRRELVAVTLGLFDTAGGRVQVEGDVREGDRVVVPSL
jgi:hypothetical protein